MLYKNILPRTLSFKEVLDARPYEPVYTMSDMHADNFAMFRYELNSIFRRHQFQEEAKTELYMGRHPLSKTNKNKKIYELDEPTKAKYEDMYRPPGVVMSHPKY